MHIVHVHITVKPEFAQAFRDATIANGRESLKETGIARFDFVQQADAPNRFVLVEVYRDADAPAKHRETAHYLKWKAAVEPMMAEPRTRQIYTNLHPPDEGW